MSLKIRFASFNAALFMIYFEGLLPAPVLTLVATAATGAPAGADDPTPAVAGASAGAAVSTNPGGDSHLRYYGCGCRGTCVRARESMYRIHLVPSWRPAELPHVVCWVPV